MRKIHPWQGGDRAQGEECSLSILLYAGGGGRGVARVWFVFDGRTERGGGGGGLRARRHVGHATVRGAEGFWSHGLRSQ